MTKDKFIELINFIKDQNKKQNNLCDALEACTDGCYCDAFIYSKYESIVVNLLKECLHIPEDDDILEWWMYDLEYGKNFKLGDIVDKETNENIDISTITKVYNYIKNIYK